MKKNLFKKVTVTAMAMALAFSMAACGEKKTDEPAPVEPPAQEESAELSAEDYKTRIQEISTTIGEETAAVSADMDPSDPEKTLAATKTLVEKATPLYDELANLKAPAEFAEAQEKIKSGAEASNQLLALSLEMIEIGASGEQPSAEKVTELTEKMTTLTTQAQDLATGIGMLGLE